MSKADMYLYIGRAVIAIYLFIVFILVLAETIERSNISATEPDNYDETSQVLKYVVQNIAASPISSIQLTNANATSAATDPFYTWSVTSDWCWCKDNNQLNGSSYPYLGACSVEDLASRTKNCSTQAPTSIVLDVFKGASITFATDSTWSFPQKQNNTCSSSFDSYQASAGLCTRSTLLTQVRVVNSSNSSIPQSRYYTYIGSFASVGNSTPPFTNLTVDTNLSNTTGYDLYVSQNLTGSPYSGLKVSRWGLPCLNPSKAAAPSTPDDYYPLTGNSSQGCGYWNTSEDLYQALEKIVDWNFFLNNDFAKNSSFFRDLYGFMNSTINENAFLYAERKLIVNDTDFCYKWVRDPDVKSNIEDIPNLNSMRSAETTVGFIVVAVAAVAFIAYLIATRSSKNVTKESVGIYVFWFEHGLGCMYAVVAVAIGSLTNNIISTIDADNSYLNDVADAACVTNVPVINNVYVYLADGISGLYDYVQSYNDWNVDVSIAFLVLEAILLVCWLIFFQCHKDLEDEEAVSDTRKLRS